MANDLILEVKIDKIEEPRTGVSKQGNNYYIQAFQSTIIGYNPKTLRFEVNGEDRVKMMNLQVGQVYKVWLDVSSRRFITQDNREMWNNDIRVYMATPINA